MDIKSILQDLGFHPITNDGQFYRTRAIYRDGGNAASLRIHQKTGRFSDFGSNSSGTFKDLISLCSPEKTSKEIKDWIDNNLTNEQYFISNNKILMPEIFDPKVLDRLMPIFSFYKDRGISDATLKAFQGGLATKGKMKNRFVFPALDAKGQILGFAGRDVTNKSAIKWKILGPKAQFAHPIPLVRQDILDKSSIILVESIGDALKLWENEIKNVAVLFGLKLQTALMQSIISLNPKQIIIATNNEPNKGAGGGSQAALDISGSLKTFFDEGVVKIALPLKNDFGVMSNNEVFKWKEQYNV